MALTVVEFLFRSGARLNVPFDEALARGLIESWQKGELPAVLAGRRPDGGDWAVKTEDLTVIDMASPAAAQQILAQQYGVGTPPAAPVRMGSPRLAPPYPQSYGDRSGGY